MCLKGPVRRLPKTTRSKWIPDPAPVEPLSALVVDEATSPIPIK